MHIPTKTPLKKMNTPAIHQPRIRGTESEEPAWKTIPDILINHQLRTCRDE